MNRLATDIETAPDLPGLYELVTVDETDSARAYAERLAAEGAEEGTLVWVRKQTAGIGRAGKYWMSGRGNLHCAIILRPEDPFDVCCQLSLVASVCASQSITLVGEPMEELRLGWPNDVYLNRGKVAGIQLSGALDSGGGMAWMVVALNVNTFEQPASLGFAASSLRGEGFERHGRVELLECFAREFLAWINRWAEDGLAPVRKAWLWRGGWTDDEHHVDYQGDTFNGTFSSLEDDGSLTLNTAGSTKTFELAAFYRPELRVGAEAPAS